MKKAILLDPQNEMYRKEYQNCIMRNNNGINQRKMWPLATHRGRLAPQKRPAQGAICRKNISSRMPSVMS